jgi:hypothetical protein
VRPVILADDLVGNGDLQAQSVGVDEGHGAASSFAPMMWSKMMRPSAVQVGWLARSFPGP